MPHLRAGVAFLPLACPFGLRFALLLTTFVRVLRSSRPVAPAFLPGAFFRLGFDCLRNCDVRLLAPEPLARQINPCEHFAVTNFILIV